MTGYEPKTLNRARSLRRSLTEAEKRLWSRLRDRQLRNAKFRRQQPIGPYIVDFVCQEHRLIIECDGSQHVESDSDRRRDAWLRNKGYHVLHFWNNDVLANTEGVLTAIFEALGEVPSPTSTSEQARKSPYPLPQGERKRKDTHG